MTDTELVDLALRLGFLSEAAAQSLRAEQRQRGAAMGALLGQRLSPIQVELMRKAMGLQEQQHTQVSEAPAAPGLSPRPAGVGGTLRMPERLGPYAIERELARGGMGAVFVARHVQLDRPVALKVMLSAEPTRLRRFQIEARVTARLRHPNIVSIHEVGEEGGTHFLVMDLIEGESLAARVERGPLEPRAAAEICEKLARALAYAHEHGILHRDLKPANVLLDERGEPLLTDFGLARLGEGEGLTRTGQRLGTPAYMAPEQAKGSKDWIDPRTDVYALGVVLYELLTGGLPYGGDDALNLLVAILHQPPEPISSKRSGVARDLETICLKCLEKESPARYASAAELAEDLRRYLDGEPIQARRASRPERALRWLRRRPLAATAALVCLGLALFSLGLGERVLRARRWERAAEAEGRGLARAAEARRLGWPRDAVQSARASLREAVELDPRRFRAWLKLARLALEADDAAAARRCLERAEALGPLLGEARYVLGCLQEREGEAAAALESYQAAEAAGVAPPSLPLRLARVRARVHAERGQPLAAEDQRWLALRAGPRELAPLVALVEARLRRGELRALSGLWTQVHQRLALPGELGLQQLRESAELALEQALEQAPAQPRAGARALLAAPRFSGQRLWLRVAELAEGEEPLLREAARASLLLARRGGASGGAGLSAPAALSASFARWQAEAGRGDAVRDALEAMTLLEVAPRLRAEDLPVLAALGERARGATPRGALALALALAGSREEGIPLERALAALESLGRAGDEQARGWARAASEALTLLRSGAQGPPAEPALLLARELWLAPGLARSLRVQAGYPEALGAATASAWVHWARASERIEAGELSEARHELTRALKLSPEAPDPAILLAQLDALERPEDAPPAPALADPGAAERAAERVAFARRYGACLLAGPNDALRLCLDLRRPHERALSVRRWQPKDFPGVAAEDGMSLRTRFAFHRWDHLRLEGNVGKGRLQVRLHAGRALGETEGGVRVRRPFRRSHSDLSADGQLGASRSFHREGLLTFLESLGLSLDRARATLYHDDALEGSLPLSPRGRRLEGTAGIEVFGGRGEVRRLVLEGRPDFAPPPRPAPPPSAERIASFRRLLQPLPGALPLERRGSAEATKVATLGELRERGWEATTSWNWSRQDVLNALRTPPSGPELEVRASVRLAARGPRTLAGVALVTLDGDAVFLGVAQGLGGPRVRLGAVRRGGTPEPILEQPLTGLERPVTLWLERVAGHVLARYQPEGGAPVELLAAPLPFPLVGEVGGAVFAEDVFASYSRAHLSGVEIRAPQSR